MKNGKNTTLSEQFQNLIKDGTFFYEFIASYQQRKAYVSLRVTFNLYVVGE